MINRLRHGPTNAVNKINEIIDALNSLINLKGDGLVTVKSSTTGKSVGLNLDGLRARIARNTGGGGNVWTLYRITSEATGDGLYTCRKYDLDASDWSDTTGASKIVANADTDDYTVLNLNEFDPESTYVAHLHAADLIFGTSATDDEGNARIIGIPARQYNADRPRIAYCNADAGAGKTIAATLDTTSGTAITVHCEITQAGTNLDEAIPRLADNDIIYVSKIWDGTNDYWRCLTIFQPSEDCNCLAD